MNETMIDSDFGANALGAGGGNRTPRLPIGFGRSTIKLHRPKMWLCYPAALRTTTKTFPAQQFLSPVFSEDVRAKQIYSLGGIEFPMVAGVL